MKIAIQYTGGKLGMIKCETKKEKIYIDPEVKEDEIEKKMEKIIKFAEKTLEKEDEEILIDIWHEPYVEWSNCYGREIEIFPVELKKSELTHILTETMYTSSYNVPGWWIGMTGSQTLTEFFTDVNEASNIIETILEIVIDDDPDDAIETIIDNSYVNDIFDPGYNADYCIYAGEMTAEQYEVLMDVISKNRGDDLGVVVYGFDADEINAYSVTEKFSLDSGKVQSVEDALREIGCVM